MLSYFLISNDQLDINEATESEPISLDISTPLSSNISAHETSSNCQPLFRCNDLAKNMVFNMCYGDYVEFKHYVNDIKKSVSPNSELSASLSDKITSKNRKSNCLKRK